MEKIIGCDLCGKSIRDTLSHNALPIIEGRCCEDCNDFQVLPARTGKAGRRPIRMKDMAIAKRKGRTRKYWVDTKNNLPFPE
jgi:hypothetical protein